MGLGLGPLKGPEGQKCPFMEGDRDLGRSLVLWCLKWPHFQGLSVWVVALDYEDRIHPKAGLQF